MTGPDTQCSGLVEKVVVGQRLDSMTLEVIPNLIGSMIPSFGESLGPGEAIPPIPSSRTREMLHWFDPSSRILGAQRAAATAPSREKLWIYRIWKNLEQPELTHHLVSSRVAVLSICLTNSPCPDVLR